MKRILRINASSRLQDSHSRRLADYFVAHWLTLNPDTEVVIRDLILNPIPHISEDTIAGFYTLMAEHDDRLKQATALSDELIKEIMAADDKASQAIWLDEKSGAVLGLQQSAIAIECSTLSISWCKTLAKIIATKGAAFIDAPVIGSRPQAEAKQLIHLVGGEQNILEKVREILNTSAVIIHHVGETGAGMSMKLAVNALFGIQTAALAEILGILSKAGIPKNTAVSLLNNLPTTSPALKGIGTLIADENYAPLFPINLVEKDFCYLEQLATSVHAKTPSATLARQIYQQAKNSGYSEHNIAGVAQLY